MGGGVRGSGARGGETRDGHHRLGAVVQYALLAGPLLSMLDSSIVNVAIAPIARDLSAPIDQVQWVASGYLLALGVGLTATPFLAHRFGTLPVYRAAVIAFTIASALCAAAPEINMLIAARVLQGLAGAPMVPLAMSMLLGTGGSSRSISPIAGMMLFLGPALGPSVGGALIGAGGWRWIFLINVPLGVVAVVASRRLPPSLAAGGPDRSARFDLIGWLLLAVGLTLLLFGASQGSVAGWSDAATLVPIAAGLVLLAAYGWRARRAARPVIDPAIMRNRTAVLALVLCAFASVVTYAAVFLLPVFAQQAQGYSAFVTGLALLPQGVLTGLSMVLGERVLRHISVRATVVIGFAVLGVASLGVLAIDTATPLWATSAILACRAVSLGLIVTPLLSVMLRPLPQERLADASSLFSIGQRVAGSFGIGLIGSLYAQLALSTGPVAGLRISGAALTGLCAVGLLLAALLPTARNTGIGR